MKYSESVSRKYPVPKRGIMRDPKRIPEVLDELRKVWEKSPDLRLGQLIDNIVTRTPCPLFYIEDEDLVERIKRY